MQALPVSPFTLQKCYRELITRVIKEGHIKWKHQNKQLSESGELTPRPWSPKSCTLTAVPTPHKRKRDVAWSTKRITETNMQKILHKVIHTTHTITENIKISAPSGQGDKTGGSSSEGECVGGGTISWDGDRGPREIQAPAEYQPHIDIGAGMMMGIFIQ
jgi:hypothetical protein